MAHTPSSHRPTLLAASTTASYSAARSRTPPSASSAASSAALSSTLSPASTSNMVATNGGLSSHSQPNLGGSINIAGSSGGGGGGGSDHLEVSGASGTPSAGEAPRKCSTASASIMDLYGNSSQLGNRSMQRDLIAARATQSQGGGDPSGGSPGADPRKSRKFLNHWKQATSLTKIGSREAG